ncbi:MAG: hypothetical protein ACRCWF_08440 [Beijerinckiaceae bacterium]
MADGALIQTQPDPRTALAARLWRAAELQAAEVEARIAMGPRPAADAEKDARVLSVLAKTLRELAAVDAAVREDTTDDEDAAPDDIDELRAALGDRLRRINTERRNGKDIRGKESHS